MVIYCKKCVMTDQRPGIKFDENGICYPCLSFENRKNIDWNQRWKELENLCNKHRNEEKDYDSIITVSGGKDSVYQVYLFKEVLKMNPLCITIDNFSWTQTGRQNYYNLSDRFGVDMINFTFNRKELREIMLSDFLDYLHPEKYWDVILYKKPLELAKKLGITLVVWGENTSEELGGANYQKSDNASCLVKDPEEFKDLDVIFTSYYVPWKSLIKRYEFAKEYGFKGLNDTKEWNREGYQGFEYVQVDTVGYLINEWCKFIKFGFSATTEHCSNMIRHGEMTREKAIEMVNEYDWRIDPIMLNDFCEGLGISKELFWKTVDWHANRNLLEKRNNVWRLKKNAE